MRLSLLTQSSAVLLDAVAAASPSPHVSRGSGCRCFPGEPCWPSAKTWSALNQTVGGRLIASVPLGAPCHVGDYNATACASLQDQWTYPEIHFTSSSSVMAPIFANDSCDPWQPVDRPCTLGNYVRYAVNVTGAEDVAATLRFASTHNLRLVVRNTGHDYLGRSTGAGALAVWTHHLKAAEVLDWQDCNYTGKAIKFGAGIQGFEALETAHAAGLTVITGECPSVGLTGGYTQGGGHSALSTAFGLAADNTLAFEVVLPSGELVTASRAQHSDLYWALSGGGPGNLGVVLSATFKAFADDGAVPVSGAKFAVAVPDASADLVYDLVDAFHAALPAIVDEGVMIIYYFAQGFLQVPAMTAYNKTQAEAEAILAPFFQAVADLGLSVASVNYTQYSTYYDHYNNYWGPLPNGNIEVGASLFGGRLIPRKDVPGFSTVSRQLIDKGVVFIGVGLDVSPFGRDNQNAAHPAWRDALISASITFNYNFTAPFDSMWALQDEITNEIQPLVEAATPGAGVYMNEADFQQTNFQDAFYGSKYAQLLALKKQYDPDELLYVPKGVGSENWTVSDDGHLCRA